MIATARAGATARVGPPPIAVNSCSGDDPRGAPALSPPRPHFPNPPPNADASAAAEACPRFQPPVGGVLLGGATAPFTCCGGKGRYADRPASWGLALRVRRTLTQAKGVEGPQQCQVQVLTMAMPFDSRRALNIADALGLVIEVNLMAFNFNLPSRSKLVVPNLPPHVINQQGHWGGGRAQSE